MFGRRVAAALIDAVACSLIVALAISIANDGSGIDYPSAWALLAVWALALPIDHATMEWRFGTTPGKRLLGLAVADVDGGRIAARQAIARNLLRPLDAVLLYAPSGVVVLVSAYNRHLGDRLAGTIVGKRAVGSGADGSDTRDAAVADDSEETGEPPRPAASGEW